MLRLCADNGDALYGCPVLGLADQHDATEAGNPSRNPLAHNGDTPTGTYQADLMSTPQLPVHSYGIYPPIRLTPCAGDALKAAEAGRSGLLIHGGAPSATGGLRPTHGCLRVSDADLKGLRDKLQGQTHLTVEVVQS
jgi:lipoprotein-anchoring transpeptidase ErfK/SrfK